MADKRGPADLDEVFEEFDLTEVLARVRERFRGINRKRPQSELPRSRRPACTALFGTMRNRTTLNSRILCS